MTPQRWDSAWTTPRGSAPERPAGEPSFAELAGMHLAFFFGLGAVGGLLPGLVGESELAGAVASAVLFVVAGAAGLVVRARRTGTANWLADLLLAAATSYLAAGAAGVAHEHGASDAGAVLAGVLVALPWAVLAYALHRRLWCQVALVAVVVVGLHAAFELRPGMPTEAAAGYLLVVAAFLAALAEARVALPVRSGHVLAALVATAGARLVLEDHALLGALLALGVLALVVAGVLVRGNRSLLPVVLIGGLALFPPVLEPVVGFWQAVGLAAAIGGAGACWLALDVQQRSVRAVHVGGVFAISTLLLVLSVLTLIGHGPHQRWVDLAHALAVTAGFVALAVAGRRAGTVLTGLLVLSELPEAVTPGAPEGLRGLLSLGLAGACVLLTVRLGTWSRRPAAAPGAQEQALAGPGREWSHQAPYPVVLDTAVSLLAAAGLPLQLLDRAGGRVVAGDAAQPVLVLALWGRGDVTWVRAAGAPHDVDRFETDLVSALLQRAGNGVAGPH